MTTPVEQRAELRLAAEPQRIGRWFSPLLCVLLITLAGTLLRFWHLDRESMWFDEGFSIWITHLDWHSFWRRISGSEANMLLYYLLLRLWVHFGETESLIRSLSALAGSVSVPLYFALCRRMFNTRVAVIGSLFLALNVYHIAYSQEARGYSLVVLFSIVSTLFFVRAIEKDSPTDWAWYVIASTLACYSQVFALLVLGAQWVSLLALTPRELLRRRFVVSSASIALLALPLVWNVFKDTGAHLGWISHPTASDLYLMLCEFAAMRQGYRLLAFGLFAACLIAVTFSLSNWRKPEPRFQNWHVVLLLSWFILPISLTFLISQWKPAFADRFLIVSLPALLMLAALGISRIPSRWISLACLLILVVWQIRCIRTYESKLAKEDWRGATAYLVANGTSSDGLIFYKAFCQISFDYYSRLQHRGGKLGALQPFESGAWRANLEWLADPSARVSERFPRVWLVESHQGPTLEIRTIEKNLSSHYSHVSEQDFRGVRVLEYSGAQP